MLQQSSRHYLISALDSAAALAICIFAILYGHHNLHAISSLPLSRIRFVDAAFGMSFAFGWQYCLSIMDLYNKFAVLRSKMLTILKAVGIMMVPLLLHLRFFHADFLSVRGIVIAAVALFCFEVDRVTFFEGMLDHLASRDPQQVIILGSGRRAGKAWRELRTRYHSSINLLGFVDDRSQSEMSPDVASRYLGTVDQLDSLLLSKTVDMVLVAMPIQSCYPLMQRAISIAERVGVEVVYLQDVFTSKRRQEPVQIRFGSLVPLHERYVFRLAIKRLVDIFGASVGLILLAPVMLCVAIAVKMTSRGPILFAQERYGHRRRRFRMLKFRSMVHNAEDLMKELEDQNEAAGPIFKIRNDPRITKVGRLLRTMSLDELPQLWNVLIGDMSLVGPRPMSVRDVSLFNEATLMRRFSVKPGITGLWQVNGRSEIPFEQWIEFDFNYIDRWSLLLDLKIMWRTVSVVMRRSGAM